MKKNNTINQANKANQNKTSNLIKEENKMIKNNITNAIKNNSQDIMAIRSPKFANQIDETSEVVGGFIHSLYNDIQPVEITDEQYAQIFGYGYARFSVCGLSIDFKYLYDYTDSMADLYISDEDMDYYDEWVKPYTLPIYDIASNNQHLRNVLTKLVVDAYVNYIARLQQGNKEDREVMFNIIDRFNEMSDKERKEFKRVKLERTYGNIFHQTKEDDALGQLSAFNGYHTYVKECLNGDDCVMYDLMKKRGIDINDNEYISVMRLGWVDVMVNGYKFKVNAYHSEDFDGCTTFDVLPCLSSGYLSDKFNEMLNLRNKGVRRLKELDGEKLGRFVIKNENSKTVSEIVKIFTEKLLLNLSMLYIMLRALEVEYNNEQQGKSLVLITYRDYNLGEHFKPYLILTHYHQEIKCEEDKKDKEEQEAQEKARSLMELF